MLIPDRQLHVYRATRYTLSMVVVTCVAFMTSAAIGAEDDSKGLAFFESRIRPVLVEHCYSCHSAKAKAVKGGLRLDSAAHMLTGGDSGPTLVKGKPAESLLISALRYEEMEMPPAGKLPDQVVRDFEQWVAMGAPDSRTASASDTIAHGINIEEGRNFWAFQPFHDHEVPRATDHDASSIDAFIDRRLESAGLSPMSSADHLTLIRRLYFDITGLPPTVKELEAAATKTSTQAIEEIVDSLLNSPQFGVHWGRHWLDVARYADSNGGDFNATFHNAWKYRDYVVDAMNNDKPFDQFIREQLAGDLLPFDTDYQRAEHLVATGFLMVGTKMLSERDKEKLRMDVVDEQISTVGSAFLGLTLGCARCHDHKFDPIPTRDYYALAGIFRSTRTLEGESQKYVSTWRRTPLPADPEHVSAAGEYESKKKELESKLAVAKKTLAVLENQKPESDGAVVDDTMAKLTGTWKPSTLTPTFIGKGYVHDNREGKGLKSIEFRWMPPKAATFEVRLSYAPGSNRADNVPVTIQHADGTVTVPLDQTKSPPFENKFAAVGRFRFVQDRPSSVTISNAGTKGYVIADAVQFVEVDNEGRLVVSDDPDSDSKNAELEQHKSHVSQLQQELKQLNDNAPPPLPKAIAAGDMPQIDDCRICIRGEHRNPGEVVPRSFLQVAELSGRPVIGKEESGRRELADWVASPQNPLTARVIVNRVWYYLIGQGLVRSIDNFGRLGERPTHPELLDHLAARFVTPIGEHTEFGATGLGWSIKAAVREIVLTEVYQRSSVHDERSWNLDPENRLLWKAHRRRLTAEEIRDTVLCVSGQLDFSPGGSPVEGLGTLVKTNDANAEDYSRDESTRRSLYLPIIRNELPPILTVFDFADPDLVTGQRASTNVPAQALLLMNSPFVMKAAQKIAVALCERKSETASGIIAAAYRSVLSRTPSDVEIDRGLEFLQVTEANEINQGDDVASEINVTQVARFIHVLFASTEFRMLD